jgi:CRP-like cAMP-binding protein
MQGSAGRSVAGHQGSRVLASLGSAELARFAPLLEAVACRAGELLAEPGRPVEHVHFPVTCVAASLYTTEDGFTCEHGIVGNDGVAGLCAVLGGVPLPGRIEVLIGGTAFRASARAVQDEFGRGGALHEALLRYTRLLLAQLALTAVCHRRHGTTQRLARLLLHIHDRSWTNTFPLTQESVANVLGVRRESVNHAAATLSGLRAIRRGRGEIEVTSRARLEMVACECYRVIVSQ